MKDHITSEDIANTDLGTTESFAVRAKLLSKYFPRKWVLKYVFHLSDKEIVEIEHLRWLEENPIQIPGPGSHSCQPVTTGDGRHTSVSGDSGGSVVINHGDPITTTSGSAGTFTVSASVAEFAPVMTKIVRDSAIKRQGPDFYKVEQDSISLGDVVIDGNVTINGMLTVVSEDGKEVKLGFDDSSDKLVEPREPIATWKDPDGAEHYAVDMTGDFDIDRLKVGPNDILIWNIRTTDIPPSRVESYLRKAKANIVPLWEKVGIEDRVLYVAGDTDGFSVIHVDPTSESEIRNRRSFKPVPISGAISELSAKKSPHNIPIIG